MRILIFSSSYLPCFGGLQTVVHFLSRELLHNNHKVMVVTNRYPQYLRSSDIIDDVPIRRWLFLTPDFNDLRRGRIDLFLASLYFFPFTFFNFTQLIKSFQPEVINVHFPDVQIPFILRIKKQFNFRLVVSLHGHEIERWFSEGFSSSNYLLDVKLNSLKLILCQADIVTACSVYLLKRAIQLEPTIAKKGRVIYNGIDLGLFANKTPFVHFHPYIFSYGRFVHKKGFDILLEAFKQVTWKYPGIDLILAGDGEERKFLESKAFQLGLEKRVFFYGYANLGEIAKLLAGCQFVVIPSRIEAFGLSLLEAMASGKTVIATHSGGPQELIEDGVNGLLVEKENPKLLADAIIRLLEDKSLRNNLAINAQRYVQRFNITDMASQYLEAFNTTLR